MSPDIFQRAADLIREADGLLVTAGAGLGVDSGLPDFRSDNGFWITYPALAQAGIRFESIASPCAFHKDPRLAWGFYGHRLNLYRETVPHRGFALLQTIGAQLEHGLYAFTSNVDGHFQKSGIPPDRVSEIHGSIHHLHCLDPNCSIAIWDADRFEPEIDAQACRLVSELPICRYCGGLARPNILMFGYWAWRKVRAEHQGRKFTDWMSKVKRPVVIEIGAGTDVPTIRMFSDTFSRLIRINPRDHQVHSDTAVSLPMGGLEGIEGVAERLLGSQICEMKY